MNQDTKEAEIEFRIRNRKYSLASNLTILALIILGSISKHVDGMENLYKAMPVIAIIAFILFMVFMKKSLTCTICGGSMKINGKTCAKCGHCFESKNA